MLGVLMVLAIAIALAGVFLGLFVFAARRGQFDDLDDPPRRMMQD